jgi:hypothetical protein
VPDDSDGATALVSPLIRGGGRLGRPLRTQGAPSGNSKREPHPQHRREDGVTPAQLRHASAELELVRRRRELFFWTIRMTLSVIVLVAIAVAFIVSLIEGATIDAAHMAVGAGITGATVSGGQILTLLRRLPSLPSPRSSRGARRRAEAGDELP